MKKVLIISYYWPPSGGAGVQRWVKLVKYLSQMDVECFILTVDENESSYNSFDYSLESDIPEGIKVFKTKSFEPTNIYAKIFGKEKVPSGGFANVDNSSAFQKTVNFIRSNVFIPDPRVGWNRYALKQAKVIIKEYGISNVITTSPPHSTQLIGLQLKKIFSQINWIADLRDPWTDIFYYEILNHSKLSHSINKSYERKVIEGCDQLVTVSKGFASIFAGKGYNMDSSKTAIIPNGYDHEDFIGKTKKNEPGTFTMTYTGTVSEQYNLTSFLDVLSLFGNENIKINFVGSTDERIQKYAKKVNVEINFLEPVPHNEVVQCQLDADLLLLFIPDIDQDKGIVPGKLFEYMATKNPILGIGPVDGDAANFIDEVNAGKMFDRDQRDEMFNYLNSLIQNQGLNATLKSNKETEKFSRRSLSQEYLNLLK